MVKCKGKDMLQWRKCVGTVLWMTPLKGKQEYINQPYMSYNGQERFLFGETTLPKKHQMLACTKMDLRFYTRY